MATYYAITTTNPQGGWRILGVAGSRQEAEALRPVLHAFSDVYAQTQHANFAVLPTTQMVRRFGKRGLEGMRENWVLDRV